MSKTVTHDDGTVCDGLLLDGRTILVRQYDDESFMKMKVLHELLHVAFSAHTGDALEGVLGKDFRKHSPDREELVVSFLEPILFAMLAGNKLLRFPKPPKL